jgi:predicted Fe-Mo cluster-binding NifX family protein
MAAPISDCAVLLARGMGAGAYASLEQAGIRPILTTIANIEEAALQAAAGTIVDHRERLH